MDVAADDPVQAAQARIVESRLDEASDVAFGRSASPLQVFGQRPVAQATGAPQPVDEAVREEDAVVQPVTELFLHVAEVRDVVVVVAMGHQQAAAIGGDVDRAAAELHARQHQPAEATDAAVVVARHVHDHRAGAGQRMQGLDHALLGGAPGGAALGHPPEIDDVTD